MTPSSNKSDHPATTDPLSAEQRLRCAGEAMRRTWLMTAGAIAATGMGLAACSPVSVPPLPPSQPAPQPTPTPPPAPVAAPVSSDWQDQPITPGNWTYRADARAARALYGPSEGDTRFTVACEPGARVVRLWRSGTGDGAAGMTITTTSTTRTLATSTTDGPAPQTVATLAPHDPILDAMIFSRGRFAVSASGLAPLYLPNWAEIARVVEDCR